MSYTIILALYHLETEIVMDSVYSSHLTWCEDWKRQWCIKSNSWCVWILMIEELITDRHLKIVTRYRGSVLGLLTLQRYLYFDLFGFSFAKS
jgi:hypothetical protein